MEHDKMQYVLRNPIVKLERCDKIWETLKLIRAVQDVDPIDESDDNKGESTVAGIDQSRSKVTTPLLSYSHKSASYIKYQPVLNNGNTALPNFRFSVKSTKKVYYCETCGKQYGERRSMRIHSEKVHGIIVPRLRQWRDKSSQENNLDENVEKLRSSTRLGGKLERNYNEKEVAAISECVQSKTESMKLSILQDMESERRRCVNSVQKLSQNAELMQVKKAGSSPIKNVKTGHSCESERIETRSTCRQLSVEPAYESGNISLDDNETMMQPQPESIQCTLCNRHCKNIRKHFTEYHKIKYPDLLIQASIQQSYSENGLTQGNFDDNNVDGSVVTNLGKQNKTRNAEIDHSIGKVSPALVKENHSTVEKHKLEMPFEVPEKRCRLSYEAIAKTRNKNNALQCDICFGIYFDIGKHRRRHKRQGETKENFHLFECRYTKSPLKRSKSLQTNNQYTKKHGSPVKVNENIDATRGKDSMYLENTIIEQVFKSLDGRQAEQFDPKTRGNLEEYKCDCGRYFRNSYTLFSHKGNCKYSSSAEMEKSSASRTSSDRDSGIGISITIKKKNDSYEIVSRESGDEGKSKDYGLSKICDLSSDSSETVSAFDNDENDRTLDSLEYSKDHSILKLQFAEEDVDVDIEDTSLSNCYDTSARGPVTTNTARRKDIERNNNMQEINVEIMQKWDVPPLTVLCKKVLAMHRMIGTQHRTYNCRKCQVSYRSRGQLLDHTKTHKDQLESCTCGIKFYSMDTFNAHLVQFHPLCMTCAYCKEKFNDIVQFEEHQCYVVQGKAFEEPFVEALCSKCNTIFDTFGKLYRHFKVEHTNPALPFRCFKCPEQFPNKGLQKIHFNSKHACSLCSVCNKAFFNEYVKFKHEAYHRGLGFPCHSCKKTYFTKGMLTNHTGRVHGVHTNEEVICVICLRTVKAVTYKRHVEQHNMIIECEVCHKRLYTIKSLKKHVGRFHRFEYPYKVCSTCGISFITKESLETHIKSKKSRCVNASEEERETEGELLPW